MDCKTYITYDHDGETIYETDIPASPPIGAVVHIGQKSYTVVFVLFQYSLESKELHVTIDLEEH